MVRRPKLNSPKLVISVFFSQARKLEINSIELLTIISKFTRNIRTNDIYRVIPTTRHFGGKPVGEIHRGYFGS